MLQFAVGSVEEFLRIDNDSLVGAVTDFTGFVKGFHLKGNNLAFHSGNSGLSTDIQTHGSGGDMFDIQGGTDRGLIFGQCFFDGLTGCTFHQGNHAGGGVNQQVAGAYFFGGVFPFYGGSDLALHANNDFHMYHNLST